MSVEDPTLRASQSSQRSSGRPAMDPRRPTEDPTLRTSQSSYRSSGQPAMDPHRSSHGQQPLQQSPYGDIPTVPHNEYPMDGMTQFCRIGPPSERSSIPSPTRPDSRDDTSDYSNPTSFSSIEPTSGHQSPTKQFNGSNISSASEDKQAQKKKSGFFQSKSPFRRRSTKEKDIPQSASITPSTRNTWAPAPRNAPSQNTSPTRPFTRESRNVFSKPSPSPEPEPVDPRANFQLNIGNNVFDVASPDARKKPAPRNDAPEELDPIAQALAELKGVTKQSSVRVSADRYAGLATPAPPRSPAPGDRSAPTGGMPTPLAKQDLRAVQRGTPPPSYDQPVSRLGAPQPAFTSKQMQQTTASYVSQKRDVFNAPSRQSTYEQRSQSQQATSRPGTRDGRAPDVMRAASPAPLRSRSPRPDMTDRRQQQQQHSYRAASPNPYTAQAGRPPRAQSPNPYAAPPANPTASRPRAQSNSPVKPQPNYASYNPAANQAPRALSPQPQPQPQFRGGSTTSRPPSSRGSDVGDGGAMVLAPAGDQGGAAAAARGRGGGPFGGAPRPTSQYYGNDGAYAAANAGAGAVSTRVRTQSAAGQRQYTKDGRAVLHYCKSSFPLLFLFFFS